MKFSSEFVQCELGTPLGTMVLAASASGLVGAWFVGQKHAPHTQSWTQSTDHMVLQHAVQELKEYFAGERLVFTLPLDLSTGTPFQQTVWSVLLSIPAGQTFSYGDVAHQIGKPTASRAVGAAVGRNPISIVVPCHRVVGSAGQLTGYAGGLARKTALLQLESFH